MGPNKSCPDQIVPLTNNVTSVTTAINNLTHNSAQAR